MKTLHMVTADPFRTPTFTPFADPDWFFFATGGANLRDAGGRARRSRRGRARASPGTTATSRTRSPRPGPGWSGPACRRTSATPVWTDHTDVRPTMLTPARTEGRLPDRRSGRGRAALRLDALPSDAACSSETLLRLGAGLQAAHGVLRLVRDVHARRLDAGSRQRLVRRRQHVHEDRKRQSATLTTRRDALMARDPDGLEQRRSSRRQALNETRTKDVDQSAESLINSREGPGRRVLSRFTSEGSSSRHRAGLEPFERQARVAAAMEPRAPDGRRPRTCASPGACGPRAGSARARGAEAARLRRRRRAVVELDARRRGARARSSVGLALDLGLVDLLDLVARMREPVRERRRRS